MRMAKANWAEDWKVQFLERVRTGLRALESISSDKDMPHKDTIYVALKDDEGFSDDYARAREARGDHLIQEASEIASLATPENVQVARVQIDLKKWTAARMAPKQYGDKVQTEISGPNGGPIQTEEVSGAVRLTQLMDSSAKRSGTPSITPEE